MNWLKAFFAAVIGGAAGAVGDSLATGHFNLDHVKGAAVAGALVTVGAYLKQSPIQKPPQQ